METLRTWPPLLSAWYEQVPTIGKEWRVRNVPYGYNSGRTRGDNPTKEHEMSCGSFSVRNHFNLSNRTRLLYRITSILSLLWYLIPRQGRPVRKKAFHELHPLAYLDALRGYLALIIFTGHTMPTHWKWIPNSVLAVPWFHFLFRGGFTSLDIFFWISGYSITYRIVGFMQAKQFDRVLDTLTSSIFRRYPRLFLPMLPITFLTVMAVATGIAIPPTDRADKLNGINPFWFWIKDMAHALNPFTHVRGWWDGGSGSALIDPLWSLTTEFRSSMIMFTFCAATCKMTSSKRKMLILCCIPAFVCWQAQWAAMAFLGMWFAERKQQQIRRARELSMHMHDPQAGGQAVVQSTLGHSNSTVTEKQDSLAQSERGRKLFGWTRSLSPNNNLSRRASSSRLREPLLLAMFLYSFIYLKDPHKSNEKKTYPHYLFNLITPDHWHIQMKMHLHLMIGAFMMLLPLDQMPILQRPLLTPFSQYLGELSFGIYLVHFPVRWILWDERYVHWQHGRLGNDFDLFQNIFPGYAVMAICVLWAADLFRRLDMQVVKFCKHLETWMFE